MSRNTRSSGRRKKPNPALYVGYVEDDETTEMIMKKFAEMERMVEAAKKANREQEKIEQQVNGNKKSSKAEMSDSDEDDDDDNNKKKKKNSDESALTEEQLVSLFNDTSYYSINSLKRNNDIMFQKQTIDEDGFVVGIHDPDYEKLMFEVDYAVNETDMINWLEPELNNIYFSLQSVVYLFII